MCAVDIVTAHLQGETKHGQLLVSGSLWKATGFFLYLELRQSRTVTNGVPGDRGLEELRGNVEPFSGCGCQRPQMQAPAKAAKWHATRNRRALEDDSDQSYMLHLLNKPRARADYGTSLCSRGSALLESSLRLVLDPSSPKRLFFEAGPDVAKLVRTCRVKLTKPGSMAMYSGSGTVPHHLRSLLASHAGRWPPCCGWLQGRVSWERLCISVLTASSIAWGHGRSLIPRETSSQRPAKRKTG